MLPQSIQFSHIRPLWAHLLAVLVTSMLAPLSPASVVVYDNSAGVFQWKLSYNLSGTDDIIGTFLDITQPATQSGLRAPGGVGVWYEPNISSSEAAHRIIVPEIGGETSRTDNVVDIPWNDDVFHVRPTRDYEHGEYVSSRDNWQTYSIFF